MTEYKEYKTANGSRVIGLFEKAEETPKKAEKPAETAKVEKVTAEKPKTAKTAKKSTAKK